MLFISITKKKEEKQMTKKLTALILSCLMAATLLASCGKDKDSGKNKNNGSESAISSESAINSESIGSEGVISSEEPSVEEPSVEEPSIEEPSVEEPSVEEPSVEEPSVEEPSEPEVPSEPDAPSDGAPAPGSYHGIYGNYIFQNSDKLGIVDFLDDNMVFNFLDDKGNVWYMGMYEEPRIVEDYVSIADQYTFEGECVVIDDLNDYLISWDSNKKLHVYSLDDGNCTEIEYEAPFDTVDDIYMVNSGAGINGIVTLDGVGYFISFRGPWIVNDPAVFSYTPGYEPMESFGGCFGNQHNTNRFFYALSESDTFITYGKNDTDRIELPEGYTAKDVKKVIANTSLAILFNDNSVYYESEYMIPDLSFSGFEYKGSGTVVDIGLIWGTSEVNELIILMDDKTIYK